MYFEVNRLMKISGQYTSLTLILRSKFEKSRIMCFQNIENVVNVFNL